MESFKECQREARVSTCAAVLSAKLSGSETECASQAALEGQDADVMQAVATMLEIVPQGVNKWVASQLMLDHLGLPLEAFMAVGGWPYSETLNPKPYAGPSGTPSGGRRWVALFYPYLSSLIVRGSHRSQLSLL